MSFNGIEPFIDYIISKKKLTELSVLDFSEFTQNAYIF
ncbi:hypothetical protein P7266_1579 [Lactococcus cremoris]|nr:hypothetical protein P7266_1579 [Lactococcus cremoris]